MISHHGSILRLVNEKMRLVDFYKEIASVYFYKEIASNINRQHVKKKVYTMHFLDAESLAMPNIGSVVSSMVFNEHFLKNSHILIFL